MNQTHKLSLFLVFGYKPMKDVILHHPNWKVHCGETSSRMLEIMQEKHIYSNPDMAIEAIPEKLFYIEILRNMDKISHTTDTMLQYSSMDETVMLEEVLYAGDMF